jgi:hypothetical protein
MPALKKIPALDPTLHQILSPSQFLSLVKTDRNAIKTSKVIPPRIGSRHFGKVYVEYYYIPGKRRIKA